MFKLYIFNKKYKTKKLFFNKTFGKLFSKSIRNKNKYNYIQIKLFEYIFEITTQLI